MTERTFWRFSPQDFVFFGTTLALFVAPKKAFIIGITGQDGSYLAELLLAKGHELHGIIRRSSTFDTSRIDHLCTDTHLSGVRLFLFCGDVADSVQMVKLLYELQPGDYVVAMDETHSVKEFCRESFGLPGLEWERYVKYDKRYELPAEVELLIGNQAKARKQLGWEPKVRFKELVETMVEQDLQMAKYELQLSRLPNASRSALTGRWSRRCRLSTNSARTARRPCERLPSERPAR